VKEHHDKDDHPGIFHLSEDKHLSTDILKIIGYLPPLASVAAMTAADSQVVSKEHNWK
jgi:hypothetical protein